MSLQGTVFFFSPHKRLYYLNERVAAPEAGEERERKREQWDRERERERGRASRGTERQRQSSSLVQSIVPFIVADPLHLLPWGRVGMFRDKAG